MDIFYNPKGIGDVLIIPLHEGKRSKVTTEKYQDVTRITDKESGKVLGYNVFQASRHLSLSQTGKVQLTEELYNKLKEVFQANGLEETLELDLSPKFVVGKVVEKKQHESADKLSVCQVDIGEETVQIVCGAPNVAENQKVVVAKVGAVMPSGTEIKAASLRGVDSYGMICSKKELGLPDASEKKGIYVLEDSYKVGQVFDF